MALELLSEKEKAVIVLHYFEDRSIKEIASILQIPAGTVKYHLSILPFRTADTTESAYEGNTQPSILY